MFRPLSGTTYRSFRKHVLDRARANGLVEDEDYPVTSAVLSDTKQPTSSVAFSEVQATDMLSIPVSLADVEIAETDRPSEDDTVETHDNSDSTKKLLEFWSSLPCKRQDDLKRSYQMLLNDDENKVLDGCPNLISLLCEVFPEPSSHLYLTWSLAEDLSGEREQDTRWMLSVLVCGREYTGKGTTKKIAKLAAAKQALNWIFAQNESADTEVLQPQNVTGTPGTCITPPKDMKIPPVRACKTEDLSATSLANTVAEIVHQKFNEVCESHRVSEPYRRWAVLAGIVLHSPEGMKCVSLGTGTKCIEPVKLSLRGLTVKDCHAEVLALRGFRRFLSEQIQVWSSSQHTRKHSYREEGCVLVLDEASIRLKVRPEISFSLYISSAPCGDSRVFSLSDHENGFDSHPQRFCRGQLRLKIEAGMGGVLVPNGHSGKQYWDSVSVSTRLLVMSCSDKLLRRNVLGLQGTLLSVLLQPVYLENIVVGHLFNRDHMERAMFRRLKPVALDVDTLTSLGYRFVCPRILQSCVGEKRQVTVKHCVSLFWMHSVPDLEEKFEILDSISGKSAGRTSSVAKATLGQVFLEQVKNMEVFSPRVKLIARNCEESSSFTYSQAKELSTEYSQARDIFEQVLSRGGLQRWVHKLDEEENFSLVVTSESVIEKNKESSVEKYP